MGKRSRKEDGADSTSKGTGKTHSKKSSLPDDKAIDPSLALLFASSAGPVKAPPKSRYTDPPPPRKQPVAEADDTSEDENDSGAEDEELSSVDEDLEDGAALLLSDEDEEEDDEELSEGSEEEPDLDRIIEASAPKPDRKRKRKADEEDLEGKYMQKLAREEEKEEEERQAERRLKRQRTAVTEDVDMSDAEEEEEEDVEDDDSSGNEDNSDAAESESGDAFPTDVPVHESLAPTKDTTELEKATRTVFLANVSTEAITSKTAKKTLMTHMGSFFDSLPTPPEGKPPHKVESLRFRSTAYAGTSLPKKAAFVKKDLMVATTKSSNAYVVYSTAYAAREAVKRLNGAMVLDRHLRVDGVAHPAKTDHRRCVFVGNLGFVDDESLMDQGGENERKRSKIPSDIEEGLWRQFGKAGTVESVRVVRDEKTRVGKGFAYVQFEDANAVEAALLFNDKKYPPMLPRVLRVVRAKAVRKTANAFASHNANANSKAPSKDRVYNPKMPAEQSSLQGRAGKLLGRAGAAQFKKGKGSGANDMVLGKRGEGNPSGVDWVMKTPEKVIFEGYRATSANKPKFGGKGKKSSGKPANRGAKRASAWKKGGAKKAK